MSNDVTTPDGGAAPAPPPRSGRRKLWVAAGVAGLTGVVGLAALGGIAARNDKSGEADRVSDAQASTPKQNVSDAGKADDGGKADETGGKKVDTDEWSGGDWSGKGESRKHDGRVKDVPCDTDKLIQAITFANEKDGAILNLARHCTYELTRHEHGNGLPVIKNDIVLKGDDTRIVRAATAEYFRILNVGRNGHLTLKDVTVKGGQTAPDLVPQPMTAPGAATAKPGTATAAPAKPATRGAATTAPESATPAGAGTVQLATGHAYSDGAGILVQRGGKADIEHSAIVQNQAGASGGGIANYGTTNLRTSSVERNSAAGFGGGVFNAGVLRIEDSKIGSNSAGLAGGGISNGSAPNGFTGEGGTVWVWKTTVEHNRARVGGGLYDRQGTTTLTQSQVTGNTGTDYGGGIFVEAGSKLHLEQVVVAGNFTEGMAGGIGVQQSTAVIERSVVKENESRQSGGGLGNFIGAVTLRDSEIVANRATGPGAVAGGIYNVGGAVKLVGTKVVHNMSADPPGGIYTTNDGVVIDKKSAVKDNRPTNCVGSPVVPDNCFG